MDEISFHSALEASPIDSAPLLTAMAEMNEAGKTKTVEAWMGGLLSKLTEQNDVDQAMKVIHASAVWNSGNRAYKMTCKEQIERLFREDPDAAQFIAASSFDNVRLRATECVRRLQVLRGMDSDVMCYDKTWGFGIIQSVVHSEGNVYIDFEKRAGHHMAFSYAAESLNIIDENHLLARRHSDPDGLQEMVKKNAAEVVRIALRSFGPKPVPIIQELLVPAVVKESGWKRFWDSARKELKQDPLVIMPAKRSEPIELLDNAKAFDDGWYAALNEERDMNRILDQVMEFLEAKEKPEPTEENKEVLANRLAFCVKGGQVRYKTYAVRAILMADRIGIEASALEAAEFVDRMYGEEEFLAIDDALNAKDRKEWYQYMLKQREEDAVERFKVSLYDVDYTALNELIDILFNKDLEVFVREDLRKGWNKWESNVFQLYWLSKHMDKLAEWEFGTKNDLALRILANLESDFHGEENRVQNQLRELFRNVDWLKSVMAEMDERQRRTMTQTVKKSTGWEQLDRASVMGQIVKLCPDMESIVSGRTADQAKGARGPMLSFATFARLKKELTKLIREDIPLNSKEIGVAREHGDLRENFEYKAARDMQRLLLQRQEELERQLATVTPTDFSIGFEHDEGGIATGVEIEYEGGHTNTFFILGEYDSDEALNIISTNSGMARALKGAKVGETLSVPSEHGEVQVVVKSVMPMSDAVKTWIGTEDLVIEEATQGN